MQAIGRGIAATSSPIFFHSVVDGGAEVSWYAYSWYFTIFAQLDAGDGGRRDGKAKGGRGKGVYNVKERGCSGGGSPETRGLKMILSYALDSYMAEL